MASQLPSRHTIYNIYNIDYFAGFQLEAIMERVRFRPLETVVEHVCLQNYNVE